MRTVLTVVAAAVLLAGCRDTTPSDGPHDPSGGRYPPGYCQGQRPGVCPDNTDYFP